MEEIITAVMQRLKDEVPELRWIDINIGQMATENPPVDYPCALVDIPCTDYSDAGGRVQLGKVTLEVELYFIVRTPMNMAAPEAIRQQSLSHFGLATQVYKALQGFSGESFTALSRKRATRTKDYYPRSFQLSFECSVKDSSAAPVRIKLNVPPRIEVAQ